MHEEVGQTMSTDEQLDGLPRREPEGLLGSLLGGGEAVEGGGLDGLLGMVLGGSEGGGGAAGGGLGGLLGGVLGGGEAAGGGGLQGLLGEAAAPLIERLVSGLGLSPRIAQVAVGFVLDKLLGARRGEGVGGEVGALLARLRSDQAIGKRELRSSGLAGELAAKAGLDTDTAVEVLLQVLSLVAGKEPPKPRKKRETTKKSAAKRKPARKRTARKTAAKKKPAKRKTAKKSTAKKKPAKKKSAKKKAAKRTPAKRKTARKTTAKKRPARKKPAGKTGTN